jgi:hypothetical protein
LHDERVRRGRSAKLRTPWIGPYEIVDIDDVNVTLRLPRNRTLKVHANRLKPFLGLLQDHDLHAQTLEYLPLVALLTLTTALDVTIQKFKDLPGLYYDHTEAQLYSTE